MCLIQGFCVEHNETRVELCFASLQRAARSQISTAVSFEGARPAGSVAVAARSTGGESAHSFADHEGIHKYVLLAFNACHCRTGELTEKHLICKLENDRRLYSIHREMMPTDVVGNSRSGSKRQKSAPDTASESCADSTV